VDAGGLAVVGDYYLDFPLSGCLNYKTRLEATFAVGGVTSDVYTTLADHVTAAQPFTGDGALATATEQIATIGTLEGEQIGRVKLTVAGGSPVFTRAECAGW